MKLTAKRIKDFQKKVCSYYEKHGRDLPWRRTRDPYKIWISEVMLQQTQVSRVVEKYTSFLKKFPDVNSLVCAPLRDVLSAWQGLGYNCRAVSLKNGAVEIAKRFNGKIPSQPEALDELPGIGINTAGAICAFAFDLPVVFIETNIRAVFIHEFFADKKIIHDDELLPLIAATLDKADPRQWYYALMDYGVMLKKEYTNPSRKSTSHITQKPFHGSDRQIRGMIIRLLIERYKMRDDLLVAQIAQELKCKEERAAKIVAVLVREEIVKKSGKFLSI